MKDAPSSTLATPVSAKIAGVCVLITACFGLVSSGGIGLHGTADVVGKRLLLVLALWTALALGAVPLGIGLIRGRLWAAIGSLVVVPLMAAAGIAWIQMIESGPAPVNMIVAAGVTSLSIAASLRACARTTRARRALDERGLGLGL